MMTVVKCFSVLVASGNGNRCRKLRDSIREQLLIPDPFTGQLKVTIHKYGKRDSKNYQRICAELSKNIQPFFLDIDDKYFCQDNRSIVKSDLTEDNQVLAFRRLLEKFMSQGRWAGWMADQS